MVATIVLVGVAGFGSWHLKNILRVQELGKAKLVALVDPVVRKQVEAGVQVDLPAGIPLLDSLGEAIALTGTPQIVIISVPIHLHASITREALVAGADVLLEKPPFSRLSDFQDILEVEQQTGRVVQIGFQSLGSLALPEITSDNVGIGKITAVRAMGTWLRRKFYWSRSPWVGRKNIGNIDVVDGVTNNSLAHAVATALYIAGIRTVEQVRSVEVEAYRANKIDVDDTTSLRVTSVDGRIVTAGLTLCAGEQTFGQVEVAGDKATIVLKYERDKIEHQTLDGPREDEYGRVNLLENLIAYRETGEPLLVPLASTGAFMCVTEALRTNGEPVHIERKWIEVRDEGEDSHPVIQDVEKWIRKAADENALFSEVGAPWAWSKRDSVLYSGELDGTPILSILDGNGTVPSSSPRPYIHPIRTLSGIEVTATRPADHDWHHGLGFAIPDVNRISFWGGGTFIKGQGYVMLDNHGTMGTEPLKPVDKGVEHTLLWTDPSGTVLIRELRSLHWTSLDGSGAKGYSLRFSSTLQAVEEVSIGSPGTNGRENAGYGGFFWRLPRCTDITICSDKAEGEDGVHGSIASWVSWSAMFGGRAGASGDATLVFMGSDEDTQRDPWVVRSNDYPGVGSAIAWKDRVEIPAGKQTTRSFTIAVMDGKHDRGTIESIVASMQ